MNINQVKTWSDKNKLLMLLKKDIVGKKETLHNLF